MFKHHHKIVIKAYILWHRHWWWHGHRHCYVKVIAKDEVVLEKHKRYAVYVIFMAGVPNATVTVVVTHPNGTPVSTNVQADENGAYVDTFVADAEGNWTFEAVYDGDPASGPCNAKVVIVATPIPPAPAPTKMTLNAPASVVVGSTVTVQGVLEYQ